MIKAKTAHSLLGGRCDFLRTQSTQFRSQTSPRAHHTNPVPPAALLAAASRLARPSERTTAPNRSRARKRPISIDFDRVSARAEQRVVPVMACKARAALGGGVVGQEGSEAV